MWKKTIIGALLRVDDFSLVSRETLGLDEMMS